MISLKTKLNKKIFLLMSVFIVINLVSSFSDDQTNNINDVLFIEQSVYNKNYSQEELASRISRLEQTLLGESSSGDITCRLKKLKDYTKLAEIKRQNDSKNILLSLLESRLYNRSYEKEDNLKRIDRLESTIFGFNYHSKTENERFDKLINDVPIKINAIKVTQINNKAESCEKILPKGEFKAKITRPVELQKDNYSIDLDRLIKFFTE